MMKHLFLALTFAIFLTPMAHANDLAISHAYAYATAAVQKNGAAFLTLRNDSGTDHVLTSASADIANTIEIHSMTMDGDIMEMRRLDALDIKAGSEEKLHPMGNHIMLIDLEAPLKAGQDFTLTLAFKNGDMMKTTVHILAPGTMPDGDGHMHGHDHHH